MTRPCLPPRSAASPIGFDIPEGACDCHAHIFGPFDRFPLAQDRSYTPQAFPVEAYLAHLDRFGLARGVLVTASVCGTDNEGVLDALRRHPTRLRGVAVPSPELRTDELDAWHEAGIRAVRVNLYRHGGQAVYRNGVGLEVLEALAPALRERGWHAQIWVHAPDLVELGPRLRALGLPLVVDHMGRMSTARGVTDPGFQLLCEWLAEGVAWTKISGADRNTVHGAPDDVPFADVDPFAKALLKANPERVVWGSDWPHINYFDAAHIPDDGVLLGLLSRWLPDARDRKRVLVDNPAALYGF